MWLHPLRRIRNAKRRLFKTKFDYTWITLDFVPPELPAPPRTFIEKKIGINNPPPFNLWDFRKTLHQATRIPFKGLIIDLRLHSIGMEQLARFQSLVEILTEFRDKQGREIVVFANQFTMSTYWFAVKIATPGQLYLLKTGTVDTRGLCMEKTYLGDTLEKYGLKFEKVAVSGFKGAYDEYTSRSMSPERRENYERLLDDVYEHLATGIQESKSLTSDEVEELVNEAPWTDEVAVEKKIVDGLVTPDIFPTLLGSTKKPAKIIPWEKIGAIIPLTSRRKMKNAVGLVSASGTIMDGRSRDNPLPIPVPFIGGGILGDLTFNQVIRRLSTAKNIKSVVLHVDSPGGSATASESMRGALVELATRKPLIIYMGNIAASGGYFITMPGKKIIAQRGTITGSIGVFIAKISIKEALAKQEASTERVSKGKHANWGLPSEPYSDEEREKAREGIETMYSWFIDLVNGSRGIDEESLRSELAGGRVWTGKQALERGLVDENGSLTVALARAREMAGLHTDAPVALFHPAKVETPPPVLADPSVFIKEIYTRFQDWRNIRMWAIMDGFPVIRDA